MIEGKTARSAKRKAKGNSRSQTKEKNMKDEFQAKKKRGHQRGAEGL